MERGGDDDLGQFRQFGRKLSIARMPLNVPHVDAEHFAILERVQRFTRRGIVDRDGQRCGEIHAAMLPIGAYAPRWFMREQHMDPEDAVKAFAALGAARFVAMHWGTFKSRGE